MSSPPSSHPELIAGVETRDFGTYAIAASPSGGSMLYLKPEEFPLLALMDGAHTTAELEERGGAPVDDLLTDMRDEGYLTDSPPRPKHHEVVLTLNGFEFDGFDRFIRFLNAKVGHQIFSRRGAVTMAVVGTTGFVTFLVQLSLGWGLTVPLTQPVLAFLALRLLSFGSVGFHESAHAMVIERHGRHVGRFGIGFYWGSLSFYCDASQAMFFDRSTRMLESGAGLIADLVVAGGASLIAIFGGGATWATVLRELAVIIYLGVVLNSIPLLELDGYWLVADAIERPSLHHDSLVALQRAFRGKVDDPGLVAYALASSIFGVAALGAGAVAFWGLFGGLFHVLWAGGALYKTLAVFLVLPYGMIIAELVLEPFVLLFRSVHRRRVARAARQAVLTTSPPGAHRHVRG